MTKNPHVVNAKGQLITKVQVIGTRCTVYEAYEPSSLFGPHSSLTSHGERYYGSLTSRPLPPEVNALKLGEGRGPACNAFWKACCEESYEAIVAAFPEAASGEKRNGQITVYAVS